MSKLSSKITNPEIKLISGRALDAQTIRKLLELKNDTVNVNIIPNVNSITFKSAILVSLNVGEKFSQVYEIPRYNKSNKYYLSIDGVLTADGIDESIEKVANGIKEMKGVK